MSAHTHARIATLAGVTWFALLWAAPGVARAQGLSAPVIGTGESGPVTFDVAAIHWNPGALAFVEDTTVLVGGAIIGGRISYQRERRALYQREDSLDFAEPVQPEDIDAAKTGIAPEATATPLAPAPALFVARPVSPTSRLVAGLGIYAPYAAIVDYGSDGAQRWALQEATIAVVYLTPALSWRITDTISVGGGLSYVHGRASMSRVQDFAALADVGESLARRPVNQANSFGPDANPGVRELAVMARPIAVDGASANALTFNAGVAFALSDYLRLGLAYQHGVEMNLRGRFTLDMNDDFFTGDLAAQGLEFVPRVEGDAWLSFPLPQALSGGVAWRPSWRVGIDLAAVYTLWSRLESFDITVQSPDLAQPEIGLPDTSRMRLDRQWLNTLAVDLTGHFRPNRTLRAWLRAGYRSAASPDETIDAASPDGDRLLLGVGARYQLTSRYALIGDLAAQRLLEREVVGSNYDLGNGTYNMTLVVAGAYIEGHL